MALTITNLSDAAKQAVIDRATNAGVSSPADIRNILLAKLVDSGGGGGGAQLITVADDAAFAALTSADVNVGDFVIFADTTDPTLADSALQLMISGDEGNINSYAMMASALLTWLREFLSSPTEAAAAAALVNGNPINPSTIGDTTAGTIRGTTLTATSDAALNATTSFGNSLRAYSTVSPSFFSAANGGLYAFAATNPAVPDAAISRNAAGVIEINSGTAGTYRDLIVRCLKADRTDTTAGTTGAVTINKCAGSVNFAAAATSLVVTNSLVATTSRVIAMVNTNDTTAIVKNVVSASGSFTITLNAAATAETNVSFFVLNP